MTRFRWFSRRIPVRAFLAIAAACTVAAASGCGAQAYSAPKAGRSPSPPRQERTSWQVLPSVAFHCRHGGATTERVELNDIGARAGDDVWVVGDCQGLLADGSESTDLLYGA